MTGIWSSLPQVGQLVRFPAFASGARRRRLHPSQVNSTGIPIPLRPNHAVNSARHMVVERKTVVEPREGEFADFYCFPSTLADPGTN